MSLSRNASPQDLGRRSEAKEDQVACRILSRPSIAGEPLYRMPVLLAFGRRLPGRAQDFRLNPRERLQNIGRGFCRPWI